MSETTLTPEQWRRAAERFSTSRRFVGHWIARYCIRRRITVGTLAHRWRTTPALLWQLSVFGVPRRSHWDGDLATLAQFAGVEPSRIAEVFADAEGGEGAP